MSISSHQHVRLAFMFSRVDLFDLQGGKGRGAASSDSKRMSKLPPRLAKQRAEKEKEKQQQKDAIEGFMPKIEAWDNELANNIPPPAALSMPDPPKGKGGER